MNYIFLSFYISYTDKRPHVSIYLTDTWQYKEATTGMIKFTRDKDEEDF